jgi:hypothetical protein
VRPVIVGLGGAGGNIGRQFLENLDVGSPISFGGGHLAFGEIKGVWIESASYDTQDQEFFGPVENGKYPGYIIIHGGVDVESKTSQYIRDIYGLDIKRPGFDRMTEYPKMIQEIFENDVVVRELALAEFGSEDNPLSSYAWHVGIKPLTVLSSFKLSLKNTDKIEQNLDALLSMSYIGKRLAKTVNSADKRSYHSSDLCDSILFVASLGGGTGMGFINPITSYGRREEKAFPIFALGILTEKGFDARKTLEGKRNLGAIIAMYDLLTKPAGEGLDALIVIDNEVLKRRYGNANFNANDRAIFSSMKPLFDPTNYPGAKLQYDAPAMRRVFWDTDADNIVKDENGRTILLPPILVPCYYSHIESNGDERSMVEHALSEECRLFPCTPYKADRAYVFTVGYFNSEKVKFAIEDLTGITEDHINVYRKLGNGFGEDILILLRNPYGGKAGEQNKKENGKDLTFESRVYDLIGSAINYIDTNEINNIDYVGYSDLTKKYLRNYFYGSGGLRDELCNCLGRLERGERPIFRNPLKIFTYFKKPEYEYERILANSDVDIAFTQVQKAEIIKIVRIVLEAEETIRRRM